MWPFTRNAKCNSEPEETDWSRQRRISDAAIQALRDWREVGETFEYAGRTLVVAKHWMVGPFGITRIPCIVARYGDSQGVLRTITLDSDECIALMQHEQPNNQAHLPPEQPEAAEGTLPAQPVKRSGAAPLLDDGDRKA